MKYLEDGCLWCGSQEWNEAATDVEHAPDCPAPFLLELAAWRPSGLFDGIADEVAGFRQRAQAIIGVRK